MKNIIWSTESGVAVTTLAEDTLDSQAHAAGMIESGAADVGWVPVAFDVDITDEQMRSLGALRWLNGALSLDAAQVSSERWRGHQAEAKVLLNESDTTVLRCAEAGVAVPQAWRDYRAALRLIVSSAVGDPDPGLPARPDYPPGT